MTPDPLPTSCRPSVVLATGTEFLLRNAIKENNFIIGELVHGGELQFVIENLPKDGGGCPGKWMFAQMMKHFGDAVTGIQGNWTYGDNLATINRLTSGSAVPLDQVAFLGPTGKYALAHQYVHVRIMQATGTDGAYTHVRVLFTKR